MKAKNYRQLQNQKKKKREKEEEKTGTTSRRVLGNEQYNLLLFLLWLKSGKMQRGYDRNLSLTCDRQSLIHCV